MKDERIEMAIDRIQECMVSVDKSLQAGVITQKTRNKFTDFLKNMRTQLSSGRSMSPGQSKYVSDIENHCSIQNIDDAVRWINDYDDDLREVAVLCAEYYDNQEVGGNYFVKIRRKVLDNPNGHILSKNEFNKMCMNKYAQKVIEENKRPPVFAPGQVVSVRNSNRLDMSPASTREEKRRNYELYRRAARGEKLMVVVLKVNARPMYRSTKGGKVYKILPVGETQPLFACEKDLKKVR